MATGCGGESGKTASDHDHKHDHKHEHDHDNDHGNDHIGANSPHKIELKDAPFNAQWTHEHDVVSITIVDNEYKKKQAIDATEILIVDKGGKNEFKLPAKEKDDAGKASVFELESKTLEAVMDNEPTLRIKVGDKEYSTRIIHIH